MDRPCVLLFHAGDDSNVASKKRGFQVVHRGCFGDAHKSVINMNESGINKAAEPYQDVFVLQGVEKESMNQFITIHLHEQKQELHRA